MLARLPVAHTLHRTTLTPTQASGHLARRLHAPTATAMAPALAQPTDVRQVKRIVQGQKMMEGAGEALVVVLLLALCREGGPCTPLASPLTWPAAGSDGASTVHAFQASLPLTSLCCAGVRICRTVGTGALRNLDPFLMLGKLFAPFPGPACD